MAQFVAYFPSYKPPYCGGNIADFVLLPKCWLVLPLARHLWRTQVLCPGHKKTILKIFRNTFCLSPRGAQQCCHVLPRTGNIVGQNVAATLMWEFKAKPNVTCHNKKEATAWCSGTECPDPERRLSVRRIDPTHPRLIHDFAHHLTALTPQKNGLFTERTFLYIWMYLENFELLHRVVYPRDVNTPKQLNMGCTSWRKRLAICVE